MLFVLVLLACSSASSGENNWYKAECIQKAKPAVTMEPTKDGVRGRYVVRTCRAASPLPTVWDIELRILKYSPEECNVELDKKIGIPYEIHSFSHQNLNLSTTCPYVCLSQTLDLIFQSCYWLINHVSRQEESSKETTFFASRRPDLFIYINNSIPRYTKENTSAFAECMDVEEKVICTWLQGVIPYTEYQVTMYPAWPMDENSENPVMVTDNCTRLGGAQGSIRCELYVDPGFYTLELAHLAPWTRGLHDLMRHKTYFNYTTHTVTLKPRRSQTLWWIFAVVAVMAVSLLAGLVGYQRRVDAKKKLKRWQEWLARKAEAEEAPPEMAPVPQAPAVLVLYARDCPPAQRVATALLTLLRQHHTGPVFDLYSPEITARAAKSPAAFVRECMTSPSVTVVLLQTPALAALHTVRLADVDTLRLEEPLLPARVMYRRPLFGDTLLQYALQLMRESQPATPYRKYKLVTLSALAVDAFPSLVPYTRYALPADAPALARSLAPAPPAPAPPAPSAPPTPPAPLARACDQLVQYVRENPNYLAEQIMFL